MLNNTIIHYTRIFNARPKSVHEKINDKAHHEFALQVEGKRINTVTKAQRAEHKRNLIIYRQSNETTQKRL